MLLFELVRPVGLLIVIFNVSMVLPRAPKRLVHERILADGGLLSLSMPIRSGQQLLELESSREKTDANSFSDQVLASGIRRECPRGSIPSL